MTAERPVIGVTAYVEQARWGTWDTLVTLLPHRYVTKLEVAGARAVLLPPASHGAAEVVRRLDALVIAGGGDIDPARYGAEAHPETAGIRPDRDAGEFAVLDAALHHDLPVLGICRGMQLLTVAHGGTLHQHLPEVVGHDGHRVAPGVYAGHDVRLQPGSLAHQVLGGQASAPSYHHQGVADPGSLRATGWASDDSIEVVEDPAREFCVGVLWHPEAGNDPRLFDALVAKATRR
ncbi:gamma-glutamyl-gamma-aminobutyrate hydrolase [soil metagenome]|jgi:putative glutamine amidotransferase